MISALSSGILLWIIDDLERQELLFNEIAKLFVNDNLQISVYFLLQACV
jgi:hypothetical protein